MKKKLLNIGWGKQRKICNVHTCYFCNGTGRYKGMVCFICNGTGQCENN